MEISSYFVLYPTVFEYRVYRSYLFTIKLQVNNFLSLSLFKIAYIRLLRNI